MRETSKRLGIQASLARMTVIPILFIGIIVAIFGIFWVTSSMEDEVKEELCAQANLAINSFNQLYPGDYAVDSSGESPVVTKGDTILNSNYALIDSLKEASGTDYTLFLGSLRILTTLTQDDVRIVGSQANDKITESVFKAKEDHFYKNINVLGEQYYAYYTPIYNSNDQCVGMMAAVKSKSGVRKLILQAVAPIVCLILVVAVLAIFWSQYFSNDFRKTIQKLSGAFAKVAKGTLSNTVSPELLARKDEFGDMAHSVVDMQSSLRKLVDEDMLTGLSNRRSGQMRLEQTFAQNAGMENGFCVALGDIDFFKKFNDNYGHDCGDLVLQQIARILQNQVRNHGVCARWGGEEFLIIFTRGSLAECKEVMEQTLNVVRAHQVQYNEQLLSVNMTFGLIHSNGFRSADEMVKHADELLYYGKEHGRNQLVTAEKK